jgi:prepilin-type N-terminal cleavage/methylation domain-containing protein
VATAFRQSIAKVVKETNLMTRHTSRRGFSLIELVIVVVIIGIIAAIAIPRMSRGTSGAGDSALSGNLNVLRNAIELYATEHTGTFPTDPANQLTLYTNDAGGTSATRTATHIYGPYLRKVPPITVGSLKSDNSKNSLILVGTTDTPETTPTKGWIYNTGTGTIRANTTATELDQNGKAYSDY